MAAEEERGVVRVKVKVRNSYDVLALHREQASIRQVSMSVLSTSLASSQIAAFAMLRE